MVCVWVGWGGGGVGGGTFKRMYDAARGGKIDGGAPTRCDALIEQLGIGTAHTAMASAYTMTATAQGLQSMLATGEQLNAPWRKPERSGEQDFGA